MGFPFDEIFEQNSIEFDTDHGVKMMIGKPKEKVEDMAYEHAESRKG